MLQIKKTNANIREYKVGNNANIANFVPIFSTHWQFWCNRTGSRPLTFNIQGVGPVGI